MFLRYYMNIFLINENDYKEQSDTKNYENIQESTNTNQVGPTFFA